jgi:hypothetical protein
MFFFSHQWQMCHDFKYFEQHIEADPDLDPAILCGSDPDLYPDPHHWYGTTGIQ